jgi:hypothetical protein
MQRKLEQIAFALRQAEAGTAATETTRKLGSRGRRFIAGSEGMPG